MYHNKMLKMPQFFRKFAFLYGLINTYATLVKIKTTLSIQTILIPTLIVSLFFFLNIKNQFEHFRI